MPVNKDTISDLFRDSLGRILVIFGVFLILVGLLLTSKLGSLVSALHLLFGVCLMVVGFVVHFELFKVKVWSKEGLSTILICVAPLLIIMGIVSLFFAELDYSRRIITAPHKMGFVMKKDGQILGIVIVPLIRTYLWLFKPFLYAGVVLFTIGVLLRVYDVVS